MSNAPLYPIKHKNPMKLNLKAKNESSKRRNKKKGIKYIIGNFRPTLLPYGGQRIVRPKKFKMVKYCSIFFSPG